MRSNAREAALNIIFAQQFNNDCSYAFKKRIYRQFGLEKDDDLLFAADLVAAVEEHRAELIEKSRVRAITIGRIESIPPTRAFCSLPWRKSVISTIFRPSYPFRKRRGSPENIPRKRARISSTASFRASSISNTVRRENMKIIDGKALAAELRSQLKEEIEKKAWKWGWQSSSSAIIPLPASM